MRYRPRNGNLRRAETGRLISTARHARAPVPLSALAAALLAPAIIYHLVGILLALGFFFHVGMDYMTAFDLTELATSGYARLSTVLITLAVFITACAIPSELLSKAILVRLPTLSNTPVWLQKGAVLLWTGMIIGGFWWYWAGKDYFFLALFQIMSMVVCGAAGSLALFNRQDWLKALIPAFRWVLVPLGAMLVLMSLGESSFLMATDPKSASCAFAKDEAHPVRLLMVGKQAILYMRWDGALHFDTLTSALPLRALSRCVPG